MRRLLPIFIATFTLIVAASISHPTTSNAETGSPGETPLLTGGVTTITTDTIIIPTYPYASFLFTATNATYNIPYRWLHWGNYEGSHPQPVDKAYMRLTLENEWLRVSVLPELGGRVYEMVFKPTGNNELYRNPVIKPTNWGPPEQGWWLAAGGIEWGLPVEEHGYETAIPWSYEIITGTDGISITVRDSLAPDRLRAAVSIFLPNDRAVLIVRPRIENDRGVDLNFKWWDNAMLAPGPGNSVGKYANNPNGTDLKFVFPETQVTVHSTGDPTLPQEGQPMAWPIYNGRDLSRLQNWKQWLGFFARPSASQDWVSVYDLAHQEGVVRIFPHTIATGAKGFGMGWRNPIGAAQWTNDDSYYAELHGGLAPTFWDSAPIGAHQSIEWAETWYPFAGLSDITAASSEAALHLDQTGSQLNVTVYATRPHDQARLLVMRRYICQVLGDYTLTDIQPGVPITRAISTTWGPQDVTVVFTTDDDQPLLLYQITNDGQAPTNVGIGGPGLYVEQAGFPLTVTAMDWDCVRSYDVQVKDGLVGAWTDWLRGAPHATNVFTGTHGHMYFFRARARDLAGNTSQYLESIWGNTSTAVLLAPAPVLEWSQKLAPEFADSRQPIEYALSLYNTGNLTASVTLTDTLPISTTVLTETLWSSVPPVPSVESNTLSWSGVISINTGVVINYALSPTQDLPVATELLNTVVIEGGALPITRTVRVVVNPYQVWLPLTARQSAAP